MTEGGEVRELVFVSLPKLEGPDVVDSDDEDDDDDDEQGADAERSEDKQPRRALSRAVAYQSKTGTKHMKQLQELLQTEGFIERLESASKDPEGADAKALLSRAYPQRG